MPLISNTQFQSTSQTNNGSATAINTGAPSDSASVLSGKTTSVTLTTKTFDILNISASPVYNFYTPDEKINENSAIYLKEEYENEGFLSSNFLRNELDAKQTARYIKLSWDFPNLTKTKSCNDRALKNFIYSKDRFSNIYDCLKNLKINSHIDQYNEYFYQPDVSHKAIVFANKDINTYDMFTDPKTSDCFSTLVNYLNSRFDYSNKLSTTLETFDSDFGGEGYVGYLIMKYSWDTEKTEYIFEELILVSGANINTYLDFKVSYSKSYRYRISTLYRSAFEHNKKIAFSTKLNKTRVISTPETKQMYLCQYNSGAWSDWAESYILDMTPPDYPKDFRIIPDQKNSNKFIVLWANVVQENKDIKEYLLYRRENIDGKKWEKAISNSTAYHYTEYVDNIESQVLKSNGYVYAIISRDVHGNISNLSKQLLVKFEQKGNKNTITTKLFKDSGMTLDNPDCLYGAKKEIDHVINVANHPKTIKVMPGKSFSGGEYALFFASDINEVHMSSIYGNIGKLNDRFLINNLKSILSKNVHFKDNNYGPKKTWENAYNTQIQAQLNIDTGNINANLSDKTMNHFGDLGIKLDITGIRPGQI